nr:hypothetical protein PU94_11600 [Coprobacter secundus]
MSSITLRRTVFHGDIIVPVLFVHLHILIFVGIMILIYANVKMYYFCDRLVCNKKHTNITVL